MISSNRLPIFVALFYFILGLFFVFNFEGTGDQGDSILHYLYAKYAPSHLELYFDHWAKPFYVLVASPFAQFGFNGIKIFNLICISLTIYFTIKSALLLSLKNSWFAGIVIGFSPLVMVLTFSGLTEPLFAFLLILGFYFLMQQRLIVSTIFFSFLPFVRSEGLIIVGVIGLFLLIKKHWKILPWLALGHVLYAFAGFFVHGNLFWVIEKIPYSTLSSVYGDGGLFHYVVQLNYVIGVPIYILFGLGIICLIYSFFKDKTVTYLHLIFVTFAAFFVAHSLFWYLGIFNSMGLKRVLIAVIPLIGIIALLGINFLLTFLKKQELISNIVLGAVFMVVLIFPFLSNPASINWERDMKLTADQHLIHQARSFIEDEGLLSRRFFHAHPYVSESFSIDHFDLTRRVELTTGYPKYIKPGDVIVWDSWFAVVERQVTKELLDTDTRLEKLIALEKVVNNQNVSILLYRVK